jgi:thiol:disulfide interchange protein DsbA
MFSLRRVFFWLALLAANSAAAQGLIEKYQAGTHYLVIAAPQTLAPADGKVEVVEVFSYACHFCESFEPTVTQWQAKQGAHVRFALLPAAWNPLWHAFARAYYAAQDTGILTRSHKAVFKAVHIDKRPFRSIDDIKQYYVEAFRVPADAYAAAYDSAQTAARVDAGTALVRAWGVDGTPSFVVNGKYLVSANTAGGYEHVFDVVDFLVAKEARP